MNDDRRSKAAKTMTVRLLAADGEVAPATVAAKPDASDAKDSVPPKPDYRVVARELLSGPNIVGASTREDRVFVALANAWALGADQQEDIQRQRTRVAAEIAARGWDAIDATKAETIRRFAELFL